MTTRRPAERVEYGRPVLYSHFDGKDAIVRAVAIEGFGELAAHMRRARLAAPAGALCALRHAYLEFAATRPALYRAMFVLPTDVRFAGAETPPPLGAAFAESVAALPRDDDRREARAEVIWSALDGIAVLSARRSVRCVNARV